MPILTKRGHTFTSVGYHRTLTLFIFLMFIFSFGSMIFIGTLNISDANNKSTDAGIVIVSLSGAAITFFIWTIVRLVKSSNMESQPPLVSHNFTFTARYQDTLYDVAITIQLPPLTKVETEYYSTRGFDNTNVNRAKAELEIAINKFFEVLSSYQPPSNLRLPPIAIPTSLLEYFITSSLCFFQESTDIPTMKFDCMYVRPKVAGSSPDPFMPIGRTL